MTGDRPRIVVCGATGQQGGAVLDRLLAEDRYDVVGMSRDPDGAAARRMRDRGAEVRAADLADTESLRRAFEGAAGVFGVTTPMGPDGKLDTAAERVQGLAIVDACVAAGIQHLVLTTVLHVDDESATVPYIASKREIEAYAAAQGVPHTFLCPASFMDELGGEFLPVKRGTLTGQADGDAKVPYVACTDIGAFAALAFADPDQFVGRKLNVIGDFLSGDELAELLSEKTGRRIRHKVPPVLAMRVFAREWIVLRRTFEGWGRPPYPDVMLESLDECRRLRPDTLDFAAYVDATGFTA
ncbi:MAG: NmrA/HSCARG family protein [Acidimicrobiales bacterium]|nr:NmrA/HSCARG family protein [Acidimicrobiales bacterium]